MQEYLYRMKVVEICFYNLINFGIENVSIKRTLHSQYDPYSGINLLPEYWSSCSHLEIMTLPSGSIDDVDYILACHDPFASNGPIEYGGTGELGQCRNEQGVNIRHLGGFYGTDNFDNGVYVVEDWQIIDREFNPSNEQSEYNFDEMVKEIRSVNDSIFKYEEQ